MKSVSKVSIFLLGGVLALGTVLGMTIQSALTEDNTYQNLRRLEDAFNIITKRYVEDVDTALLSEDAIQGMIEGLDPHSVFIDASRMEDVREQFNASFEGIGISYEWTEGEDGDTLTVLNPIVGGPSEEAGLLAGDRIIQVDDISTIGWERKDVEQYLKGPKGTKVTVQVKRPSFSKILEYTITRDKIPIYTVDAKYMVDDETGYIKLNRFARTTHQEVNQALVELRSQGMERLVFDLRGNVGGYMSMAVRVSDEFLGGEDLIVYTKGRNPANDEEYRATARGSFEDQPVIVLVDEQSASASEIVAGALQDHDRALIVGRRTFGKGLVQQQFPLQDGSVLQLTTSRYYTPAGRLIQTPYEQGDREGYYEQQRDRYLSSTSDDILAYLKYPSVTDFDELKVDGHNVYDVSRYLEDMPDSLKYNTDGGRVVLGGGGILPDYLITRSSSKVVGTVISSGADYLFVRKWMDEHPDLRTTWNDRQDEFNKTFSVADEFVDAFWAFAKEEYGINIVDSEDAIPEESEAGEGESEAIYHTQAEFEASREVVETRLKAYIARRIWGVAAWFPVIHEIDPVFQEAIALWSPAEDLSMAYDER